MKHKHIELAEKIIRQAEQDDLKRKQRNYIKSLGKKQKYAIYEKDIESMYETRRLWDESKNKIINGRKNK